MSDRIRDLRGITWIKKGDPLPSGATLDFNNDASNVDEARQEAGTCFLDDWFSSAAIGVKRPAKPSIRFVRRNGDFSSSFQCHWTILTEADKLS
jgi:hypothetical protein